MKPKARMSARPLRRSGFTLVEMIVSVAVLVMIVTLVANLTNGAMMTVSASGKHTDADSQARLIFDRMALDFARMLKRGDVDYSSFKSATAPTVGTLQFDLNSQGDNPAAGTNDQFALYTETGGYFIPTAQPGSKQIAPVSLVAYRLIDTPDAYSPGIVLQRLSKGLGWEPSSNNTDWKNVGFLPLTIASNVSGATVQWPGLFNSDPDYTTIGDQVFRMEYNYLLKPTAANAARLSNTPWDTNQPSHTSVNGFKDVAAIVVAIAVLDSSSRVLVPPAGYADLAAFFPDALEGQDIATKWLGLINASNFATNAGIPQQAAAGVRVYQRYFYLDTP